MNIYIAEVNGQKGVLTPDESWHCTKVMRRRSGDNINLIDRNGNFYEAVLDIVSDSQCTVRITKGPMPQDESAYHLHLVVAPTKQIERTEWMIEKAVEMGIQEFSFITCQNSERTSIKTDRTIKIIESAVKQSLQARIPKVNELVPYKEFLKHARADQKLIGHCFETPKKHIRGIDFKGKKTMVLIGPEGDFTKEEVDMAVEKQFEPISLGVNRLRSETAGVYVCQAAALLSS